MKNLGLCKGLGLKGDEISFEGRLMAVTDIAEALTASDRPYKKAMPLETVYRILRSMAEKKKNRTPIWLTCSSKKKFTKFTRKNTKTVRKKNNHFNFHPTQFPLPYPLLNN